MILFSGVAGVLCVLFGIAMLRPGRRLMHESGNIMEATVFQYNVLPLCLGAALVVTSNSFWLVAAPFAWRFARTQSGLFTYFLPIATAFGLGARVARGTGWLGVWTLVAGAAGVGLAFLVGMIVFAVLGVEKRARVPGTDTAILIGNTQ